MTEKLAVSPRTSALLMMDFQTVVLTKFVPEDQSSAVLVSAARALAAARSSGMPVIHVMVGFRPGYPEVSPRNRLFSRLKEHGMFALGNPDTAIHPEVAPRAGELVIVKSRVGSFSGTELDVVLRSAGVETLVLAGVTTSGVVLSTVRQAFDLDYRLVVARDCCADPHLEVHQMMLDTVIPQHAAVVATAQVIDELATDAAPT